MNCKKATQLALKKEEGKINLFESFVLWVHNTLCGPCQEFEDQSLLITKAARQLDEHIEAVCLTPTDRQHLIEQLEKA